MRSPEPSLSVVVVTRDFYRRLRPIVVSLGRQAMADRIELLVVGPARAGIDVPSADAAPFHSVRVVEVDSVPSRGAAAADGVHAARAPFVALSENHCFPEAGWTEATLAAFADDWAGVGPAVRNANPEVLLSRAMHTFGYGRFPANGSPGGVEELPLHNSCYRRAALDLPLPELRHLLANERRLQRRLRERGLQLFFQPRAVKWHINEATWRLLTGMWFLGGRGYGATRSAAWPLHRRLLYALASPVLTLPIARNVWERLRIADEQPRTPALGLVVLAGAVCHAAGEAVAYLGLGRTEFAFVENEEFMIRERLGKTSLSLPHIRELVAELDVEPKQDRAVVDAHD